jgi:hypothetical protein
MTDGQREDDDYRDPSAGYPRTERANARPSGGGRPGGATAGKLPRRRGWREATALVPALPFVPGAADGGSGPQSGSSRPAAARPQTSRPRVTGPDARRPAVRPAGWPDGPDRVEARSRPGGPPGDGAGGRADSVPPGVGRYGSAADPAGVAPPTAERPPVPLAPLRPQGIPLTPLFGLSREEVTEHDDPFAALAGTPALATAAAGAGAAADADRSGRRWPTAGTGRLRLAAFVLAGSVLPALGILAVARATSSPSVVAGPRTSMVATAGDGAAFASDVPPATASSPPAVADADAPAVPTSVAPVVPGAAASPASTTTAPRSAPSPAAGAPAAGDDDRGRPRGGLIRSGGADANADPAAAPTPVTTAPPMAYDPSPAEAKVLACARAAATDGGTLAVGFGPYRLDSATWNAAATALSRPDLVAVGPARAGGDDQNLVALRVLRNRGGAWDSHCS